MSSRKAASALPIPHSWALTDWPEYVYPGTTNKGRYVVHSHRDELVRFGALTRVGRDLVVIGERYRAWLEAQAHRVVDFQIAANRARAPR